MHPMYHPHQKFIYPFTTSLFILVSKQSLTAKLSLFGSGPWPYWMLALGFGVLVNLVLCIFYRDGLYKATPRFVSIAEQFYLLITVVGSIIWLELLIHLVTSFITLVGLISGLPDIFLGATILALGISTPDTIVNISLSIQNYHMMALSAIFSGQMMNFLVGFGLSCIMRTISRPEDTLSLWSRKSKKQVWTLIAVFASSLLNLALLFLRLKLNKYFPGEIGTCS